ncbi:hypothetical protein [Geitlerinema sp. PCC 7407]|uniref:hypothetical protein n=1 Tax=Geitlerinema sp. PCC 7407 TaxID=1173025 RepID=UPI00029FBEE8|nr:hypothetical protein [Geitlerinema sp. PCC 7407]AFY67278.1 hypothetical protein GEI7407_2805 [Geitlerinema sp. PCC 7407]
MLVDDCQQLSQLATHVVSLRKNATDLKNFRDRQDKIESVVNELRPLVIALRAFRERGLVDFDCSQKVDLLLAEVTTTITEFQKEREWLTEKFRLNTFQIKVTALRGELESHLKQTWIGYKNQRVPSTNEELLGLLAKIETFKPTVQTIRRILNQLKAIGFPKDTQQFEQIDQAIDNLSVAWNSLKSNEVPTTVLNFLRAAATHGATIDLLTPEVQNWLNEHGISRFFYIRLSD